MEEPEVCICNRSALPPPFIEEPTVVALFVDSGGADDVELMDEGTKSTCDRSPTDVLRQEASFRNLKNLKL
jgi:hypothetical protein